jgi:hypothetical protein
MPRDALGSDRRCNDEVAAASDNSDWPSAPENSKGVHCNIRVFILMLLTTINSGRRALWSFSMQACTIPISLEPLRSMKILLNRLPLRACNCKILGMSKASATSNSCSAQYHRKFEKLNCKGQTNLTKFSLAKRRRALSISAEV